MTKVGSTRKCDRSLRTSVVSAPGLETDAEWRSETPAGVHRRQAHRRSRLSLAFGAAWILLPVACFYDADERCSPGQHLVGDTQCQCDEGTAFTPQGCVPCAENEIAGPAGCMCGPGFVRPTADSTCQLAPPALGGECDVASTPCSDPRYAYCQIVSGTSGYCTNSGCSSSSDCDGGYQCETATSPTFCQRPPLGVGTSCESAEDCAGTEATFCDLFMTRTCLVQGCSVADQDCFGELQCCDLSQFGVPEPLCLPPGAC
jgi:hypothetical protein